tara:strand:- start:237 stop:464 length:228 start_codon:yes stop_codon:yes gene_type:complete
MTMIVNTVVMVVPVAVLLDTTLEVLRVVRVFRDKVMPVEMVQSIVTIPVAVVVPVKLERVQITTQKVATVCHLIF